MMDLFITNMYLFTSQDINCLELWLLVDYCDIFISHLDYYSDGTHSSFWYGLKCTPLEVYLSNPDVKDNAPIFKLNFIFHLFELVLGNRWILLKFFLAPTVQDSTE